MQGSRSRVLIAHFDLALVVQEGKPIVLPIQLSLGGDNDVSTSYVHAIIIIIAPTW